MVFQGMLVPAMLIASSCALALWAYSLLRQEKATRREEALTDRELFDSGREAALRRAEHPRRGAGGASEEASPLLRAARLCAVSIVAFASAATLSGQALFGAVAAAAVATALAAREGAARKRRRELFDLQFVRMLPQLAASIRGSLTIERALRLACARSEEPLRDELARVVADVTYGTPLATSLEDMARRTGSADARALASATRMQQKFGGSVAPVLDMVAAHASARLKASRELKTELAGTRLAKWFVALSLPCIFFIMYASNDDFARFYVTEPLGWALVCAAVVFEVVGLAACHAITRLEYPLASSRRVRPSARPASEGRPKWTGA